MSELRACPFCGGEAQIIQRNNVDSQLREEVLCTKCGSSIGAGYAVGIGEKKWQSRPIEDKLQAEIDELKERPEYSYEDAHKLIDLQKHVREAVEEIEIMLPSHTTPETVYEILRKHGLIEEE